MTMETPRPAEPPCVTRGEWTITHTGERFVAVHPRVGAHVSTDAACIAAELVITVAEKLTLDLIALRDGPLPQYEVCVGFRGYSGEPLYRQVTP